MVRGVGIVGTGVVFAEHAAALSRLADRLRLVGIAEIDPHRRRAATESYFVPYATNDHRELVERRDVDVVVVATPPARHEEVVASALAAGKVVVCEKPLATNLAAIDRLIALESAAPGRLSTVHQWRYRPDVQRIVHLCGQGRLGRLVLGRFQRLARLPAGHDVSGWWGRWDHAGGGAVMTQAIHEVDLMLYLFGTPTSVLADVATLTLAIDSEDTAAATVHFESGAMAVLTASVATHDVTTEIDVIGEVASAHVPWRVAAHDERVRRQLLDEALRAVPGVGRLAHPDVVRLRTKLRRISSRLGPPPAAPMHLGYWTAVADALDRGEPLPIGPTQARRSVEVITAIYVSALEQRAVTLPLDAAETYRSGVSSAQYHARMARPPVAAAR